MTHKIDTGNHNVIKLPARRTHLAKKEVIDKELDKMLTADSYNLAQAVGRHQFALYLKNMGRPDSV